MNRIDKAIDFVSTTFAFAGAALIFGIMLLITADVVMRGVFRAPIKGVTELAAVGLIAVVFLFLAHAERKGAHVRVDLAISRLRPRIRLVVDAATTVVSLGIIGFLIWRSAIFAFEGFHIGETLDVTGVPTFPFRLVIPIGAALLFLEMVLSLVWLLAKGSPRSSGHE